jgi:pimeloyl-ACP methyl ester carboxylesterase
MDKSRLSAGWKQGEMTRIRLQRGILVNAKSWEGFKTRYEEQGCTVIAPDRPFDNRTPADLRASPDPELAKVGQRQIVDHYERIIRGLPEEPILIGHSVGGVFVPHLMDRGFNPMKIRWDNPARAPMLLIGGARDLIADGTMTEAIYAKQKQAPLLTELKIYPDRSHRTGLDKGWEEVADFALNWAVRNAVRPVNLRAIDLDHCMD